MISRGFFIAALLVALPVSGTRCVQHVEALKYPTLAVQAQLQGNVKLIVELAADGQIQSAKGLAGHPLLPSAAEDNIRKWKFQAGEPETLEISYNFILVDPSVPVPETECSFDLPTTVTVVSHKMAAIIDTLPLERHK